MEHSEDSPTDILSRRQLAWLPLAVPLAAVVMALCAMLILGTA